MTYRELLLSLRRRVLPILLASVLCGAVAFSVTAFLLPKRYAASTVFCVRNRAGYEEGITSADLAACESLTAPCIALMTGSEIMGLASESLGGMTESALKSRLSFENMGAGVFRTAMPSGQGLPPWRLPRLRCRGFPRSSMRARSASSTGYR